MNPCIDLYATATSVKYQGIDTFTVTAGGSGYTSAPTVTITPVTAGEGSGATATAVLSSGSVASITLTNPGNNYSAGATVSFSGGGGSGAAATCTTYDGSKCYIPFKNDTDLTPVVVIGSDASEIAGTKLFVESGFTTTPTAVAYTGASEDPDAYFAVPRKDLTSVAAKVVVGWAYSYDIQLPITYFRSDGKTADIAATVIINRYKFSMGLSGVCQFKLKSKGSDEWVNTAAVVDAQQYLANDVPLSNQSVITVPIHQRNSNFTLRVFSSSPFPVSLTSMMWEGNYSPRFYTRA